ncbi:ImmA/IrrE family metallo-endopeptidase [Nocardioides psychrotolerans]|uniref:IrrE N-terminal-like domain-containing protein n=1 Tax=Nocardioides psychrotolerans TaxID=1005945 RepID=A0A1I3LKA4_9ACTN|nr:hypothetical protein [Nocardioides psychrotolerans]SFI85153.1 hypothetical protein SAMN05216561_1147 [Nocardioides psychrotolerans]
MSAEAFTFGRMYHPWGRFRDLAHFTLRWAHLPEGVLGVTDFDGKTVTLAHGLDQAERRSTIAHEVEHIDRGWSPCTTREECQIERAAAQKLIGIRELGEALAWARDLEEAAEELWVDVPLLRVRLQHLHPAERAYLRRRLADEGTDEQDTTSETRNQ